ncbi:pectate lyase [Streptomyces sp. NPDC058239]|uniref:pectate lyase n=1 Tax=unclassified Streptomyces TaxID=2593676 RepID=UPI00365A6990
MPGGHGERAGRCGSEVSGGRVAPGPRPEPGPGHWRPACRPPPPHVRPRDGEQPARLPGGARNASKHTAAGRGLHQERTPEAVRLPATAREDPEAPHRSGEDCRRTSRPSKPTPGPPQRSQSHAPTVSTGNNPGTPRQIPHGQGSHPRPPPPPGQASTPAASAKPDYRPPGLALVDAQLPVGGWNYIHDFAGEASLRDWYATIGANGWRLEEFQHFYGNATFDDAGTSSAAHLILRLYVERRHLEFKAALNRVIDFMLKAQLRSGPADGGWPQRFPSFSGAVRDMPWPDDRPSWLPADVKHGMEDGDYTPHVTFNDDVLGENIKFLLMCASALGRRDLNRPVLRAMACLHRLQQPVRRPDGGCNTSRTRLAVAPRAPRPVPAHTNPAP